MTNPADNSLGSHLYADKGALNDERRRWYAGHIVDWAVRIRSVQGNTVTLERPLRLDVRRQWRPELWSHSPTAEEVGIEDLTIEFPPVEYRGHYKEAGYFAIQLTGVYNSWVRNLTILDADIGVVIGAGGYNTIANVALEAKARTGATTDGETGHYAFGIGAWPTRKTATDEWIESWPGKTTQPPNLYEAQLARQLVSLRKKIHGSKPTERSGRPPP